jgi:MoxR-like ATPase
MTDLDPDDVHEYGEQIQSAIGSAVIVDEAVVEVLLASLFARGHVLLEDTPGTGKTLLARSLATTLGLEFNRIQFTPDLLPTDITGSNIFREGTGTFEFQPGPVFANVVLADELNRAPPKTQAALLEAMEEGQVTVDGETHDLPEPFFVIATQNPVEQEGTFELPEAQRDRFIVKTGLGYPDFAGEMELIDRRADRTAPTPTVEQVVDPSVVQALQRAPETVTAVQDLREYLVTLGRASRDDDRTEVGVSPRGIQRLFELARARAAIAGRSYVVPEDVTEVVEEVFTHRLVLTPEATVNRLDPATIVADLLDRVEVPVVSELQD